MLRSDWRLLASGGCSGQTRSLRSAGRFHGGVSVAAHGLLPNRSGTLRGPATKVWGEVGMRIAAMDGGCSGTQSLRCGRTRIPSIIHAMAVSFHVLHKVSSLPSVTTTITTWNAPSRSSDSLKFTMANTRTLPAGRRNHHFTKRWASFGGCHRIFSVSSQAIAGSWRCLDFSGFVSFGKDDPSGSPPRARLGRFAHGPVIHSACRNYG
jgi:hypothetical protein